MDTLKAFAMGQANSNKQLMVFDWDAAAKLIKDRNPDTVSAGLSGDWEWTGGQIYNSTNGPVKKEDTYTYLASTWAIPEIEIDGETIDCFKMQDETDGWSAETYWPDSALSILKG